MIPLPNVPTEFEAASAGFIEVLSAETEPRVRGNGDFEFFIFMMVAIGLWFLLVVAFKFKFRGVALFLLVAIGFPCFMLYVIMFAVGGKEDAGPIEGVDVVGTEEVGSYGLSVLEAKHAKGLNEWLSANGFLGLNELERGVISDYIDEGWCFVAAKLKRDGDGYCVPHPLSMKFESEKAIYPMRLTGTVGSNVYLELFVIADMAAKYDGLTLEFADRFNQDVYKSYIRDPNNMRLDLDRFAGNRYGGIWIGHPASFDMMWDSCFVTRLCGEIEPAQMDKDIVLQFADIEAWVKTYTTYSYATGYAFMQGVKCWGVIVVFGVFIFHKRMIAENGRRFALMTILLPAVLIGGTIGGVTYLMMEKVEATATYRDRSWNYYSRLDYLNLITVAAGDDGFDGMTKDEVVGVFEKARMEYLNIFKYRAMKFGDGPGGVEILEDDRGVYLRAYQEGGFPVDYVFSELEAKVEENKARLERWHAY